MNILCGFFPVSEITFKRQKGSFDLSKYRTVFVILLVSLLLVIPASAEESQNTGIQNQSQFIEKPHFPDSITPEEIISGIISDRENKISAHFLDVDDNNSTKIQSVSLAQENAVRDAAVPAQSSESIILIGNIIPEGSFIHYGSDGTTRVFSSEGTEIFYTNDSEQEKVTTTSGEFIPASHQLFVPSGSTIDSVGNNRYISHNGKLLVTFVGDSSDASSNTVDFPTSLQDKTGSTDSGAQAGDKDGLPWAEWALSPSYPGSNLLSFSANWIVPSSQDLPDDLENENPPHNSPANIIFNGIQPKEGTQIVQPVTAYNFNSFREGVTNWQNNWFGTVIFFNSDNRNDPQIIIYPLIPVSANQEVVGMVDYNPPDPQNSPTTGYWTATFMNPGVGGTYAQSYLFLRKWGKNIDIPNTSADLVLAYEARYCNPADPNGTSYCANLPSSDSMKTSDIQFKRIRVTEKDSSGNCIEVNRQWILGRSLNSDFHPGLTGLYVEQVSNQIITLHTDYYAPVADFSADTTSGSAPLAVQFTDQSTGTITSRAWDFNNDGITDSSLENPSHTFPTGTYSVRLTVNGPDGPDTELKTDYISSEATPTTSPTPTPTVTPTPDPIHIDQYTLNSGTETVVKFTGSGSTSWIVPSGVTQVRYLVIGGGGEGGNGGTENLITLPGGGGGAGGFLTGTLPVTSGTGVPVTVGAGGSTPASSTPANGGNSVFDSITASGGGAGASITPLQIAQRGGSGGGGVPTGGTSESGATPLDDPPQGNAGTSGRYNLAGHPAGGGGGAGSYAGACNNNIAGNGGTGRDSNISGSTKFYGGGGGGGLKSPGTAGQGGNGGGGNGGLDNTACGNGLATTGSGGGGAGAGNVSHCAGGSGVVIIRYVTPVVVAPIANFTANLTSGPAPLTVQFTDTSTGSPTGWLWNFGDGAIATNATVQHPVHTYLANGAYTVSLTVSTPGSPSNTTMRGNFICVGDCWEKLGVFRNGTWIVDYNGNNTWDGTPADKMFGFGATGDHPAIMDWNHDGYDEIGVFRNGTWIIDYNGNNVWDNTPTDKMFGFGATGDLPAIMDWNHDGYDEIGVFRDGAWIIDYNGNNAWDGTPADMMFGYGASGDLPAIMDWNHDGYDEIGVFRDGAWIIDYNGNNAWDNTPTDKMFGFGATGDLPTAGHWFVTPPAIQPSNVGVYNDGIWYLDYSANGSWDGPVIDRYYGNFGLSGDLPVAGDWNGDGKSEIGVFRNSTHRFYLDTSGDGLYGSDDSLYSFGSAGDLPVAGDWNNDGEDEIGVFRNSTHLFYLDYNGNGTWDGAGTDLLYNFGLNGDLPVAGDWNNDGDDEIGVFRSSTHLFYLDNNGNGAWDGAGTDLLYNFGLNGDLPVTGDWNNDGDDEIGVFRSSTHLFYLDTSGNGAWGNDDSLYSFGSSGDKPLAGTW
ncbi:MAG: glycine-rich domain-containing protein [Methanoregula sp.]|jgi:PKD repeat protein